MDQVIDDHGVHFFFDQDIKFLTKYGVSRDNLVFAQMQASKFNTLASEVLMRHGILSEVDYYRCVAFELGLPFVHSVGQPSISLYKTPEIEELYRMARMVAVQGADNTIYYLAPDCRRLADLKCHLIKYPELVPRLKITTASANFSHLEALCSASILRHAIYWLHEHFPRLSARQVVSTVQSVFMFCAFQYCILSFFFGEFLFLTGLYLFSVLFYFACGLLRLLAAMYSRSADFLSRWDQASVVSIADEDLPYYSVLVALYDEEEQVPRLVDALGKIDWPVERLEIKLVCEADDKPTIEAVQIALLKARKSYFSLVMVPPSEPRTKPKALNYALSLCRGEYVVVYDAEDQPDPLQLREAYQSFQQGDERLACVQAPLLVHNHSASWLSHMFAIEYSYLFDGLLPFLSAAGGPVPLGGTSNHFKRKVLDNIGAWDPYNVTEDADLGVRLARAGCQIAVLTRPTYEEAPERFSIWLKQRTRWFKGWYQTWLVHMRHPLVMMKELGLKRTLLFHCVITGMVTSVLLHPLLFYFIFIDILDVWQVGWGSIFIQPFLPLDVLTVGINYCAFAYLASITLSLREGSPSMWALLGLPLYWLLLSLAAWRALWQLIVAPHHWEKTPHGASAKR